MAGESPDRSKQRESSAEPTSGSAGPVPEARTENGKAKETRDPRLEVARARGGVDTATTVLSVRELTRETEQAEEPEDAEEPEPGAQDTGGNGSADEAAPGDGADAGPGDERLRDVVAAWVRSADTEHEAEAETEGDAEASDQAEDDAETSDEAEDDVEAEGTAETTETTDEADADAEGDADAEAAAVAADDGAVEDAVPEEPRDDADDDRTEPEEAAEADAEAEVDTDAPEEPADEDEPADTAADDDTDEAASDPAPKAGAPAKPGTGTGTPKAGTPSWAKRSGDDERPVDQPTAVFKAVRPSAPAVDQPTTMLKLGGATKAPKDAEPTDAEPTDTKLKDDTKPKPTPKPTPEADRTSKFVALKPLDEPRPAAPPKPASPDVTAVVGQTGPERTMQQPLPPKPPLDLLAELTNTPPPPATPVRTLIRRVKIWTPLVLLLAIIFAIAQAVRPLPAPTLDLTAEESYTFDGGKVSIPWPSDGQGALDVQGIGSFGSSGEQKPAPIASVAKVMTTYLILRDHPLKGGEGGDIKVDRTAEEQATADGESTVEVRAGDTITEREALEGVLIASANNVARLLARWDAGSEKAFVAKMNAAAEELGMTNTTYTDPSGLEKTTVSTAVDQVKLAKAAMKDESFREIARMMEYVDYKGQKHPNWNRLVGSNGVIGIKTGTTTAAGGNLVFAAVKELGGETRTIVGAVVGQGPGGSDNTILSGAIDAGDQLIRAAQDALTSAKILKKGDVVGYVDDGLGGRTPVVITKDVPAVGWAGLEVKLSFAPGDLPHSAKAGTKVGTLTVGDGGAAGAVKVPVALGKDLVEPGFTDKLTRLG
ncbi:D-alanyl-D-alanine carboxypeptidase [Streptomyces luteolifulvus]|uniref:serine-type D-Ala-D-Ala carboxypeptidase n=1 Tax=Streptomyces luteolifulvus TaxID=2615112 RepID=A0A6H9V3Z2_9ACTN|nr:D-alanyl-D-alanine carboxypeptidase [Streptomyces luteolifulvus]